MGSLHILMVAEHDDVRTLLAEELRKAIPSEAEIRCVEGIAAAKRAIQQVRPSAVVVDHDLIAGGAAGFARSVLRMGRRAPLVFYIGVLDDTQPEMVEILRDHPEIHFIERPFQPSVAARRIRSVLIPEHDSDPSFHGLRLCELVQAFCLSRHDATLMVLTPDGRMGSVAIQGGQMVHVTFGGEEGMSALSRMVESQKGEIRVVPECLTAKRTIDRPTQQVLLEVHRQLDEARIAPATVPPSFIPPAPPRTAGEEEAALMAELDAMFIPAASGDESVGDPPATPPSPMPESLSAPLLRRNAAHSRHAQRANQAPRPLVQNTYKGLPPQTYPPPGNARISGSSGTRPGGTTSFLPKNIPPKTVQQLLTEALEDE